MLHAVIMAGGAGTRFWPASRSSLPKQLLKLTGERTMIQATVDRLDGLVDPERTIVMTNESLVAAIREQLPQLPTAAILGEPCKRDTAPCIGLAAELVLRDDPQAVMLVMPADHVIQPTAAFQAAVQRGVELVERDQTQLVTFGIKPTYPASAYGYIERGTPITSDPADNVYRVQRFREKPSMETAREFLAAGGFYWNAGIFVWRAATIRDALVEYEAEMMQHVSAIAQANAADFPATFRDRFAAIRGKSIDYAVLEKYPHVAVIEAPFEWDDLGNWQSLARTRGADADGNTLIGKSLVLNTRDSIICGDADQKHLIVTVGLRDAIVVHTPDATLIADRNDEEALREIVARLKELGWDQYL